MKDHTHISFLLISLFLPSLLYIIRGMFCFSQPLLHLLFCHAVCVCVCVYGKLVVEDFCLAEVIYLYLEVNLEYFLLL